MNYIFQRLFLAFTLVGACAVGLVAADAKPVPPPVAESGKPEVDPHAALYATEGRFPSASSCRSCHENQYRQWSVSMHAFAELSPTMEAQSAEITRQFNGSIGVFCTRCHTPVGSPGSDLSSD